MSATLLTTPAGWYHDPSDSGAWRWWDGVTWTANVRPKEETAPDAVVAAAPAAAPEPYVEPPTMSTPLPQTAPVSQPEPAAAAPVQPVTLTPATPPSEQIYWHSAEAEVVKIPGRSGRTADAVFRKGGDGHVSGHYARFWGEVGSPQTVGIWLLAFLPIIASVLSSVALFVLQSLVGPGGIADSPASALQIANTVVVGYALVVTISAWIFAGSDIKVLRVRGYDAPKIWWMLVPLSPLGYFIARGKVVRAEGKRAWPPELLFFLSIMVPTLLTVAGIIFAASMLAGLAGLAGSAGIPV